MIRGFLIVIDGVDGAGKTTQIDLLVNFLKKKIGRPIEMMDFPRYGQNIYAELVKNYLSGKFGSIESVDPHFLALAYAGDRTLAKPQLEQWLSEGKIIVSNRYVCSSKAHLGANISDEKREEFIQWVDDLEYKTNGLPREGLTIILNVDPEKAQENTGNRGVEDIHEKSLKHLQKASEIYLSLAKDNPLYIVVNCMENGKMQTKEVIHQKIIDVLKQKLIVLK